MYPLSDQRIVADRQAYLRSQANPRPRKQRNRSVRRRPSLGRWSGRLMIRIGIRLAKEDVRQVWPRLVADN